MDPIREAVRDLSAQMKKRTEDLHRLSKREMEQFLDTIGRRILLQPADAALLEEVRRAGGLFAVDASFQRFGGAAPHYVELVQGLGVCSGDMENPVRKTAAHSPLVQTAPQQDFTFSEQRSKEAEARLAAIELEIAIELIRKKTGYALIMDGSLIRFDILCPGAWEELRKLCKQKELPVVGVIEDNKTDGIGRALHAAGHSRFVHYDREILSGRLRRGEVFIPGRDGSGKAERGLSTLFAKFSTEPRVIGIDMAGEDEETLVRLARILYAITPSHGRGIPYLLDVVDEKARLQSHRTLEILKHSIDPEVLEMYFIAGRDRRRI